jgi:hypothetical protein
VDIDVFKPDIDACLEVIDILLMDIDAIYRYIDISASFYSLEIEKRTPCPPIKKTLQKEGPK